MPSIFLTKSTTFILGPIAQVLGLIMNAIYTFLDNFLGIQNIGLCIILFTFLVYMLMTPLTFKQQKFSKLQAKMSPELQKITNKYKGKKDQDSMMKQNEETKALYEKYGVSPTGSCVQMLIQLPIFFSLWRVIQNIPAYVTNIKNTYEPLVNEILTRPEAVEFLKEIGKKNNITAEKYDFAKLNTIVDVLYKFNESVWGEFAAKFANDTGLTSLIESTKNAISSMNNFIGINIAESPYNLFKDGMSRGSVIVIVGAISIPLLAGLSQWLNTRLMPQQPTSDEAGTMETSMKSMNNIMPIISAVMCVSFPAGMGLYWIGSSVVRCAQQLVINRYLDKIDIDELLKKNLEKTNKKREKMGLPPQKITNQAKASVRNIENPKGKVKPVVDNKKAIEDSTNYYKNKEAKPGSIASKANMVQKYNERNKK